MNCASQKTPRRNFLKFALAGRKRIGLRPAWCATKTDIIGWKNVLENQGHVRSSTNCADCLPAFLAAPCLSILRTKRPSQRASDEQRCPPACGCSEKPCPASSAQRLSTTITPCFIAVRRLFSFCEPFALRRHSLRFFSRRPHKSPRLRQPGASCCCPEPSSRESAPLSPCLTPTAD